MLTSGYRCAKINIRLAVASSKLPQCHKCAFLKQTNIIVDCLLHRFPYEKVRLRTPLTISGLDTIRNVSCISVQKHSYSYHFYYKPLHFAEYDQQFTKKQLFGNIEQNFHFFYSAIKIVLRT